MVPSTVAELLGDPRAGLDRHDVVPRALAHAAGVTEGAARLFDRQVGEAVRGLLDVDLAGLVLDGWSKYGELRAAARRSLERPGRDEPVTLVEHRITSTHQPAVDLYVGQAVVATITFDLEVHVDVHGLDAVVRQGRLVALRGGDVDVGARLSTGGQTIVERETSCGLGVLVPLGDGYPLLGRERPADRGRDRGRRGTVRAAVLAGLLVVALGTAGLLSGVLAVPASAWPWSQPGVPGVVDPDTAWNMRAGPSRVAKPVGVVLPGQSVRVECVERGWAKLLLPRNGTYVDGRGLRLEGDPPDCSP